MGPMITRSITIDHWFEASKEVENVKIIKTVKLFNRK